MLHYLGILVTYLLIGQNKSAKLTENGNVNSLAPLFASLLGRVAVVQVVLQGDLDIGKERERERKKERDRKRMNE